MRKGIDTNQRIPFSFVDDIEPKSVFILRPLSATEFTEFSSGSAAGVFKITANEIYCVLDRAVVEVQNFQIGEEIINTKESAAKRRVFESLELNDLNELLNQILSMNKLGRAEQKNS